MNLKTVIFGTKDYSELAHYYLTHDSNYQPVAFAVEKKYRDKETFCGLPVVDFEEVEKWYPPDQFNFFAPIRSNNLRARIYEDVSAKGYKLISYVSSKAIVSGTVGENCFIQEFNNVQPFAVIGNNCILWAGNHIGHSTVVNNHVTITSHVVISGHCDIGQGSYLGVNVTVRDGIVIGHSCMVGQGANVVKNLEPNKIYVE